MAINNNISKRVSHFSHGALNNLNTNKPTTKMQAVDPKAKHNLFATEKLLLLNETQKNTEQQKIIKQQATIQSLQQKIKDTDAKILNCETEKAACASLMNKIFGGMVTYAGPATLIQKV